MKKAFTSILICLTAFAVMCLTGCINAFAEHEYNDNEKIVQLEDRYAKEISVFNSIEGGYSLTVSKFYGRQTLWKKNLENSAQMQIRLDLSVSSGSAKVVYIDCNDNITVLIECLQGGGSGAQSATKTISLTSGLNRLKIVGCDCKDVDLKMYFDEP
ncbi:MAG: hypothetical protein HFE48_04545 [Clostridia bacterium]|nr:hypothetical protein [Clostridia bacterium]